MGDDFQKAEEIYKDIYSITQEITSIIKTEKLKNIENPLNKRGVLITKVNQIVLKANFSIEEKSLIKKLVNTIKILEDVCIQQLETKRGNIAEKLSQVNKNYRALSAYKINNEMKPRLFDCKDS